MVISEVAPSTSSSWWALGIAVAAFLLSAASAWYTRRTRIERAAEAVSGRARFVPSGDGETNLVMVLHNGGPMPVHAVIGWVLLPNNLAPRQVGSCAVLPAGATISGVVNTVEGCDGLGIRSGNPVEIEFNDGWGRKWRRTKEGRLTRIGWRETRLRAIRCRSNPPHGYRDDLRWHGIVPSSGDDRDSRWTGFVDHLGRNVSVVELSDEA